MRLIKPSLDTPTGPCSAICPAPAGNWRRACAWPSARYVRFILIRPACKNMPEWLPYEKKAATRFGRIGAGRPPPSCDKPSSSGQVKPCTTPSGQKSITNECSKKARSTPWFFALWPLSGSVSYGNAGKTASPMTKLAISNNCCIAKARTPCLQNHETFTHFFLARNSSGVGLSSVALSGLQNGDKNVFYRAHPTSKGPRQRGTTNGVVSQNWNIEHPTSNIQHRTSNIQHPTSNIQHQTSNIQHPTANNEHPTSNIQHRTSNIQHPTSNIQHPIKRGKDVGRGSLAHI